MASADTFIMQGRLLTSLLSVYRGALGVDDAQDEDRCVACSRTGNHFVADVEENVLRNTGICEMCKNVLESNFSTVEDKRRRVWLCPMLGFQ